MQVYLDLDIYCDPRTLRARIYHNLGAYSG